MATYKVIQDIEAEDKFLGPLTLKQFIFGAAGVLFAWLDFFAVAKGAAWLTALFSPFMLLGFFLAFPWSKEQSTEVWVLAKIRFKILPKKRIWDQSGMEELVTITAPKKVEKQLTNNLGQDEVKSRLQALAETIDTRGWAVKHAQTDPGFISASISDRLVSASSLPQEVPTFDLNSVPDVMDATTTTYANFDNMIHQSEQVRLQQNLDKMQQIRQGVPLEQINQPQVTFTPPPTNYQMPAQQVSPTLDEQLLTETLKAKQSTSKIATNHMHTVAPYNPYMPDPTTQTTSQQTQDDDNLDEDKNQAQASMPTPSSPAIMDLARNDDLNVETIARQAKKANKGSDEVVISLR